MMSIIHNVAIVRILPEYHKREEWKDFFTVPNQRNKDNMSFFIHQIDKNALGRNTRPRQTHSETDTHIRGRDIMGDSRTETLWRHTEAHTH